MKSVSCILLSAMLAVGVLQCDLLAQEDDKTVQRLGAERDKLKRQTNPVNRARSGIKISEILLVLVTNAVRNGDHTLMEDRLTQYTLTIQEAHQTMVKTGRDAHAKPGGFKDLEIALRRQLRQLEDLGGELSFDERSPVTSARTEAAAIRDAILKAMFGGQNAPAARS